MPTTVIEVRNLLDNLSSKQVPDDTISENIQDANNLVTHFQRTDASGPDVDLAVKRISVWLSYISFSEGFSFQRGSTPTFASRKEAAYRNIAELYLNKVSAEPVDLEDIQRKFKEALKTQHPIISFVKSLAYDP